MIKKNVKQNFRFLELKKKSLNVFKQYIYKLFFKVLFWIK